MKSLEQILTKLVSFPTLSHDHAENVRALGWIQTQIKSLPVKVKQHEFNHQPSIVITTQATKSPKLLLQAHIDIVPASETMFTLRQSGKKLIGRGVFDMKYAIACYLQLLFDLGPTLSKYDIGIMITTDEEIGGENGVKALLANGYSTKICFLPDGGQNWEIQSAAKGVLHIQAISTGKSAHGSRPWEGENALENLWSFISDTKTLFMKEPCGDDKHYHNSLTVGSINGGKVANKVPEEATALLDIRFIPEENETSLLKSIGKIAKNHHVKMNKLVSGNAYKIDLQNPHLLQFTKVLQNKYHIPLRYSFSHGSSDVRFFLKKDIPAIVVRPKGGAIHSEQEWIDQKDLHRFYAVLKQFATTTASVSPK